MFVLNVGSRWNVATELDQVLRGAVFLASSNAHTQFTRKAAPEFARVLIDPQLYLAGLEPKSCGKTCGTLATHPWFGVPNIPDFNSDTMGVNDWKKAATRVALANWPRRAPDGDYIEDAVRSALECQLTFGCTHIILPVPLLDEREDAGGLLGAWLDAGLKVATEMEIALPILASVPVAQSTLNPGAFEAGGFLEALVDQVTARDGLAGVYLVVALHGTAMHPFETPHDALHAYLHLTDCFREARCETIMVNFADVFGFACAALGATDIITGDSQVRRRLCLNGFRDGGGGTAVPHFYSHRAMGEFTTETELGRLVKKRASRRVLDRDRTPYAADLIEQIDEGGSAANVAAWAESKNNLTAAKKHFIARLAAEGTRLQALSRKRRAAEIRDALDEAEATQLFIRKRVGNDVGQFAPVGAWRDVLDKFD